MFANAEDISIEAGFALLEVLISLTLLALIASSSTLLLFQLRQVQIISESQQEIEETAQYRSLLRDTIATGLRGDGIFVGVEDRLELSVLSNIGPLPLKQYGLSLDRQLAANLQNDLYRIEIRDVISGEVILERALPNTLTVSKLSYFGANSPDEDAIWNRNWEASLPPRLVHIEFLEIDGARQPDMVIGP